MVATDPPVPDPERGTIDSSELSEQVGGGKSNYFHDKTEVNDLYGAAAEAAGLTVPYLFQTKKRRWLALILVALSGACAAGPVASWPTLQPLLMKQGVFAGPNQAEALSQVYSVATGAMMVAALPSGVLYDVLGPRIVTVAGAWCCAACLVGMVVAVQWQSMNWLLWLVYPAACFFGQMNSCGIYAWYWLLPEQQNAVSAAAGSVQVMSDGFVLLAVWLHTQFGLMIYVYFLLVAGIAILAGLIGLAVVPTLDENLANSSAVIKFSTPPSDEEGSFVSNADTGYGSFSGEEDSARKPSSAADQATPDSAYNRFKESVADAFTYTRMFPLANGVFLAFTLSLYMFTTFPTVQMYPLYRSLMGDKTAHQLVTAWGAIYPLCGMMGLVALGPLVDKLGLRFTIALCIPLAVVNSQLFTVRMYGIQIAAQVLLAYLTNVVMVFVPRFCLHYAPAEIFGTVFGLYGFMNGLCQMALTPLATLVGASIAQALYKTASKAFGFIFSIDIWAGLLVMMIIANLIHWWYRPMPAVGSVSLQDLHRFAASLNESRESKGEKLQGAEEGTCRSESVAEAGEGTCRIVNDGAVAKTRSRGKQPLQKTRSRESRTGTT